MTFDQAKHKLIDMADGEHCAIKYGESIFTGERDMPKCAVYIHGWSWHEARTWRGVLSALRREMAPFDPVQSELTEAPMGDA